jgi:hypothetical protein
MSFLSTAHKRSKGNELALSVVVVVIVVVVSIVVVGEVGVIFSVHLF